jgi:hypothetical protein
VSYEKTYPSNSTTWTAIDDDTEEVIAESNIGEVYHVFLRNAKAVLEGKTYTVSCRANMVVSRPRTLARWDEQRENT